MSNVASTFTAQRLRQETKDLIELVLLPGLAAVLPWSWCFKLFKRAARWSWLYRAQADAGAHQASLLGYGADAEAWKAERRLVTLIDHADLYLALTRSEAWMHKHLAVVGTWPKADQSALLCTFHWGAGMWGLIHAASHGIHPHALVASVNGSAFAGRFVLGHYARQRTAMVARVLAKPTLDVSQSLRPVVKSLNAGGQVLAAVDVPADQALAGEHITLLGHPVTLPKALFRLATEKRTPVYVYTTGFDMRTGARQLTITLMPDAAHEREMMEAVFKLLDAAIAAQPSLWHFWSEWPRFTQFTQLRTGS